MTERKQSAAEILNEIRKGKKMEIIDSLTDDDGYNNPFCQDLVTKRVTSFSMGNIWLYFYRETQIGVRNMKDTNRNYFLDPAQFPLPNDHYTSQHLMDKKLIDEAIEADFTDEDPKTKKRVAEPVNFVFGRRPEVAHRRNDQGRTRPDRRRSVAVGDGRRIIGT